MIKPSMSKGYIEALLIRKDIKDDSIIAMFITRG